MASAEVGLRRQAGDVLDNDSPTARGMGSELHELLTLDEVAALLKVSTSWVYEHTGSAAPTIWPVATRQDREVRPF